MTEFTPFYTQAKPKLPFLWPGSFNLSQWNPIPMKYRPSRRRPRQKSNAGFAPQQSVAALQTSFNPLDGIRTLRRRRWSLYDGQHLLTVAFLIFSFAIAPMPIWARLGPVSGYSLLLLMPATRQFFLPSLPIWTYLLYFFTSRFIPVEYRPHIWVRVLPALENVLYGANLSNILSAHTHPILDVLAWIPYGIGHFGAPAICSALLFLFAAPGTTPVFARAFGYLALLGVTMQLIFPCTPPWYERDHGLDPAHYGMEGSPAGLARVDQLFGVDMYTTSFTTAPLPFGAFPSLHAADATLEALVMSYCFPRFRAIFIGYVGWIWWATMYLNHHYAVDLVGGSIIAAIFWYVSRTRFLPRRQLDKSNRWEYEYVEIGEKAKGKDEEAGGYAAYGYGFDIDDGSDSDFGLGLLRRRGTGDSDEWTVGSGGSLGASSAGGSRSGSRSGTASSPGSLSPTTPDADFRQASIVGMMPTGQVWDGERVGRESELSEVLVMR